MLKFWIMYCSDTASVWVTDRSPAARSASVIGICESIAQTSASASCGVTASVMIVGAYGVAVGAAVGGAPCASPGAAGGASTAIGVGVAPTMLPPGGKYPTCTTHASVIVR